MLKQSVLPANIPLWHSGKVRDTGFVPGHPNFLFPVASDRLSTHNVCHKSLIPGKGEILTALTVFWARKVLGSIPTHIVAFGRDIYEYLPEGEYDSRLHYRSMIIRREDVHPIEFIWRSYLTGSLYEAYKNGEDPYGLNLPAGLQKMHRFEKPVFTPTDKSATDDPRNSMQIAASYPEATALTERTVTMISNYLSPKGITLIDKKCEASKKALVDEWGTGDCSRMAWTKDIQEGVDPPWLDKELFRIAAKNLWADGPKVPLIFPGEIIKEGISRYHEAFEGIAGMSLSGFQREYLD